MRLILPEKTGFNGNYGEKKVYQFLKENMPLNSVIYYNYTIDGKGEQRSMPHNHKPENMWKV